MGYFLGKTAVITGAASGIGRSLALQLSGLGCNLAISDVNESGLKETASLVNRKVRCSCDILNVADREAFYRYAEKTVAEHGAVDIVINNAGVALAATVEETSYDSFEWIMGINFWGVVYGTKAFLPHLKSRPAANIVNISSIFGIISVPKNSAYNATKFAVRGFTESLRQELAGTDVRVTCVHPGGIQTNIARDARQEGTSVSKGMMKEFEKNFGTSADECAADIIKAVEKGKKRLVTGAGARPADLLQRFFPASYEFFTRKVIKGVD